MCRTSIAAVIVSLAIAAVLPPAKAADGQANKELYRSLMDEIWNKRDLSAIDRYLAPDFIEHNKNLPPGIAGRKQFVTAILAAFSDYHAEIEEVVAEGNKVVARVQWTGTGRPVSGAARDQQQASLFDGGFFPHG
jgi:predicted SnoaL-like aldol condensation-catalyzing enzyme